MGREARANKRFPKPRTTVPDRVLELFARPRGNQRLNLPESNYRDVEQHVAQQLAHPPVDLDTATKAYVEMIGVQNNEPQNNEPLVVVRVGEEHPAALAFEHALRDQATQQRAVGRVSNRCGLLAALMSALDR
jgi:hypothetical protein